MLTCSFGVLLLAGSWLNSAAECTAVYLYMTWMQCRRCLAVAAQMGSSEVMSS
jgi:hypothetical protein